MQSWNIADLEVEPHQPVVLGSEDEGRAIAIRLPAGERLSEHQVHERAWLVVISGSVTLSLPGGESVTAASGTLAVFDPAERHEVKATEDSRLLLVLSPWPGVGHPSEGR